MKKEKMKRESKVDIRPYKKQFYKGNIGYFILGLVQIVLLGAVNLVISWMLQQVLDLIAGENTGFSLRQLTLIAGCILFGAIVVDGCAYCSKPQFITRAVAGYKNYVFQHITKKGIAAFGGENTNLYISALSNDVATIETNYLGNLFAIVGQSVLFVSALTMMFCYSPLLTIVSVALSLLPIAVSLLAGSQMAEAEKKVSDINETYMSTLRDSLAGFSVIKSFRAEVQMAELFAENVHRVAKAKEKKYKISILIQMLSSCASIIVQLGVFLVGAYLAIAGKGVTAGTVLVFIQLLNFVLGPIGSIPACLAQMKAAEALMEKLAGALAENVREDGVLRKTNLEKQITVNDLSFAYEEEKPVLQHINAAFEAGKSYAIVGGSGCGKSTLLNMLMAAHHGYEGTICYDAAELQKIDSESLYEMVSMVQQNVFIFNASIRDNITMFSDFPEEEVERAISLSGLDALISERGEDYLCGENGSGLSGGEKQRISIARSLLKKSQVLLMDEATAALDLQTAAQVSDAVLNLDGITRIVVTHALEDKILNRYDGILTMRNGSIVESGTFKELMEKKGYFYSLYTVSG